MRIALIFVLLSALSSGVNCRIFYIIPERMSWPEAQAYCREHYTDLASVDDQVELDELLQKVPNGFKENMWIGLYRKSADSPWIWSDQSKSMFRIWQSGQPNNADGYQFCTYTTPAGLWNDWDCPDKLAFVCYDMKRQTVRLEVKSSRNMNDPDLQKEILAKIEQILRQNGLTEGAKVWWKKISGGNVFQRMWYQKSDVSKTACRRIRN